jgi:DNA-binding transcriptional LysR family regulator
MELRHLHYFAAVAESCHCSRAAERLRIAQPALSQAVRQLEAELGTPLLERATRQVSLTPAGEFFLAETRRILDAVDAGVRGVRRIADGRFGLVRTNGSPPPARSRRGHPSGDRGQGEGVRPRAAASRIVDIRVPPLATHPSDIDGVR